MTFLNILIAIILTPVALAAITFTVCFAIGVVKAIKQAFQKQKKI